MEAAIDFNKKWLRFSHTITVDVHNFSMYSAIAEPKRIDHAKGVVQYFLVARVVTNCDKFFRKAEKRCAVVWSFVVLPHCSALWHTVLHNKTGMVGKKDGVSVDTE